MKTLWVGTSWKMNGSSAHAIDYGQRLKAALSEIDERVQPFVIPPFPYLTTLEQQLGSSRIKLGGQNIAHASEGAYTGEVSASMLQDCGAQIVEIGHSERREMFAETDERVNRKVHLALAQGLAPLICVGDSGDEKAWGVSQESVIRQVKIALHAVSDLELSSLLIAYEPIWAIGAGGTPASADEANAMHCAIKDALCHARPNLERDSLTLLYGGSVNLDNCDSLLAQPDIDGLFVGRAAWNIDGYLELLSRACQCDKLSQQLSAV